MAGATACPDFPSTPGAYDPTFHGNPVFLTALAVPAGAGVADRHADVPAILKRCYPNPFGRGTTIEFNPPAGGHVHLAVYDIRGRLIRTLADRDVTSGHRAVCWDGRDDAGASVASGIYFYRLIAPAGVDERRVVRLR